jgi:hypothetical protein
MRSPVVTLDPATNTPKGWQKKMLPNGAVLVLAYYLATNQLTAPEDALKQGEPVMLYDSDGNGPYITNKAVGQYEAPKMRIGVILQALSATVDNGTWVWVQIEGPCVAFRYYHVIGNTANAVNEHCASIEASPLVSTAATLAVLQEAVDTAVASGVMTKKVLLLGGDIDPAVQA